MPEEKKQRNQSMKWIKLGEGKDPEFQKNVFLIDADDGNIEDACSYGWLKSINSEVDGKKYGFVVDHEGGDDVIETRFTHYCIPTIPV